MLEGGVQAFVVWFPDAPSSDRCRGADQATIPEIRQRTNEAASMSGAPIRKHELIALEGLGRGQSGGTIEEDTLQRLRSLGLIEQSISGWRLTKRGAIDLQRRKSLGRAPH